jgi:hypothetical protein
LRAIRARGRYRVGDEPATLELSPKHLHVPVIIATRTIMIMDRNCVPWRDSNLHIVDHGFDLLCTVHGVVRVRRSGFETGTSFSCGLGLQGT